MNEKQVFIFFISDSQEERWHRNREICLTYLNRITVGEEDQCEVLLVINDRNFTTIDSTILTRINLQVINYFDCRSFEQFKDLTQTHILHCVWAESLSKYNIELLTEKFQSILDESIIDKIRLTIISMERQRAITQETLTNYFKGIHLLEDYYRGVRIDMIQSLGDTIDQFMDLHPEYEWSFIQSSFHCRMLTIQEEILLQNYDTNFIKSFSSIDLIEVGLSDIHYKKLQEVNESKLAKFALSTCYQNSKILIKGQLYDEGQFKSSIK